MLSILYTLITFNPNRSVWNYAGVQHDHKHVNSIEENLAKQVK